MAGKVVRAAIVGASTLLGKELAKELSESDTVVWDLTLLDAEIVDSRGVSGQIASAGDEAVLIQTIASDSFVGMDVVLFAADIQTTRKYWREVAGTGTSVVDVSGALHGETTATVCAPWVNEAKKIESSISKVAISAHSAAVMLGVVLERLRTKWPNVRTFATVMEPASQQGSAGLDEMHQQAVALLSFKPVPIDIYGVQVAFNMIASSPTNASVRLSEVAMRVKSDLASIVGQDTVASIALQFVQAPVFNGYTASIFVDIDATQQEVESALRDGFIRVVADGEDVPSNLSVTDEGPLLVSVREERNGDRVCGHWLWIVADNLKLSALNAMACASELVATKSSRIS